MRLLVDPHGDDAVLFACWALLREKPVVAVVLDSYLQEMRGHGITAQQRRGETLNAMQILGADVQFLGFRDDSPDWSAIEARFREYGQPEMVFAPAVESSGHEHHNMIGEIARRVFRNVTAYMTYTPAGKSTGVRVPYEPEWPILKLKALAAYDSQIRLASTQPHFMRDIYEYYAS